MRTRGCASARADRPSRHHSAGNLQSAVCGSSRINGSGEGGFRPHDVLIRCRPTARPSVSPICSATRAAVAFTGSESSSGVLPRPAAQRNRDHRVAATCRTLYFGERAVGVALGSIPDVRVRSVWGSADLVPKWYYTKIDIAGAPSAYIYRLTRQSFQTPGDFCFFQVGEYSVRYSAYGRLWGPEFGSGASGANSFCFDKSGDVRGGLVLFPVKIRSVREFVQNIRVIRDSLANWPRCPDFLVRSGAIARYRVCTLAGFPRRRGCRGGRWPSRSRQRRTWTALCLCRRGQTWCRSLLMLRRS